MNVHVSSVNFQNLIRDLAEMYTYDVAEVVVVELVANALDSGASRVSIDYNANAFVLTVTDNGKGMDDRQFEEYHDFAAGLKRKGTGIGFAGVGAKISFNVADRVITETRSRAFSSGSNWCLESQKRLTWTEIQPAHLTESGTRVEVHFRPASSPPYRSSKDMVGLLRRHYLPLFDVKFLCLYSSLKVYPEDLRFSVNGEVVEPSDVLADLDGEKRHPFSPLKGGKRTGYGFFCLAGIDYPFGVDTSGVMICAYGKVVKSELFNQFPGSLGPRITGLVEIPALVRFLTTVKNDFIRGRGIHKEFESYYDPVRAEFKLWMAELGVQTQEVSNADEASKLERELKRLSEDIPELGEFFSFRGPKAVLEKDLNGQVGAVIENGAEITFPDRGGVGKGQSGPLDVGSGFGEALSATDDGRGVAANPISRVARRGPKIAFQTVPDNVQLSWVEGNNVVINSGHACYKKVAADNLARRTHCMYAIGSAIQRFVAQQADDCDGMLVDRLMSAWGKK